MQKRKMKAEEEEVDVHTIIEMTNLTANGTQKQQDGAQSHNNASPNGHEEHALPPEPTQAPLINGNRNGHGNVRLNGDVKSSVKAEVDINDVTAIGTPVNGNGDIDVVDEDMTWADEEPDDDTVTWVLKVIMEDDTFIG